MLEVKPTPSDRFVRVSDGNTYSVMLGRNKARAYVVAMAIASRCHCKMKVAGTTATFDVSPSQPETIIFGCGYGTVHVYHTRAVYDVAMPILRWLDMSTDTLYKLVNREMKELKL